MKQYVRYLSLEPWAPTITMIRQLSGTNLPELVPGSSPQSFFLKTSLLFISPFISLIAKDISSKHPLHYPPFLNWLPQNWHQQKSKMTPIIDSILSSTPSPPPPGLQLGPISLPWVNISFVAIECVPLGRAGDDCARQSRLWKNRSWKQEPHPVLQAQAQPPPFLHSSTGYMKLCWQTSEPPSSTLGLPVR